MFDILSSLPLRKENQEIISKFKLQITCKQNFSTVKMHPERHTKGNLNKLVFFFNNSLNEYGIYLPVVSKIRFCRIWQNQMLNT